MAKPGIIEGTLKTACDVVGFVPTKIAEMLTPEMISNDIKEHQTGIRRAVGAAVLIGAGISILD